MLIDGSSEGNLDGITEGRKLGPSVNVTDGVNDGAAEGEFEGPLDGLVDSVIVGIKLGPCEGTELGAVVEASPAVPCPGGVVSNTSPPPTSGTPVLKECLRLRLRRLFPIPPFSSVTELSTLVTTALLLPVLVAPVAVLALVVLSALDDFLLLLFPVFLVRVALWA